jgi:hypothetical protein
MAGWKSGAAAHTDGLSKATSDVPGPITMVLIWEEYN